MVFHGRPSRDCAPCRKRKTRCDLVPTGCSQCRRAKVTCHGYRSPNELVFRDETRDTMQKALATLRASRLPSAPKWSSDVSSRHSFLSLYVGTYSSAFRALPSLLVEAGPDSHLQFSVDAASLAFMAFQLNRRDLIPLANQHYLKAIRSLGIVVQSSIQSTRNAPNQLLSNMALQSVLLLDLYEKMAFQHYHLSESPGLLLSHAKGSFSIVRSLPRAELSNPTTLQLATRSIIATTIGCGADGVPLPESLAEVYNDLGSYGQSSQWAMIGHYIRLLDFRTSIRNGVIDPGDIIKRTREFYHGILDDENKIPRSWRPYRRESCEAWAFDCYYDVYPNHHAAQTFTKYRIVRLDLASVIQEIEPSVEVAEEITQLTRAMCASVPQFILPEARPQNTIPFSPLQILECSALLQPLFASAHITQDPEMRAWIIRTLKYMANNGVRMAQSVANFVEFSPQVDNWTVSRTIGSYAAFAS